MSRVVRSKLEKSKLLLSVLMFTSLCLLVNLASVQADSFVQPKKESKKIETSSQPAKVSGPQIKQTTTRRNTLALPSDYYAQDEVSHKKHDPSAVESILNAPAKFPKGIKRSIKKLLNWIENYYVVDKTKYFYEQLTDRGIYPIFTRLGEEDGSQKLVAFHNSMMTLSGATGDDRWQPVGIQYLKPDLIKDTFLAESFGPSVWGRWSLEGYQDYGARLKFTKIFGTRNNAEIGFRYQSFPKEDFFGLGTDSNKISSWLYHLEETSLNGTIERELIEHLTAEIGAGYSHFDMKNSPDDSKANILDLFPTLDGVDLNSDIVYGGIGVQWDTRDNIHNPQQGEYARVQFGPYAGTSNRDVAYLKYKIDAAKYINLKKNRVLAGRFFLEFNQELANNVVPFFDKAKMGGPRTVRGYQFNRFFDDGMMGFNLEYRYRIWKFRTVEWDLYPFWDGGWVFPDFGNMDFDSFKTGYGVGSKFRWLNKGSISIEVAHSREGTDVYVKFTPTF